jgi:hypothetical protein
VVVSGDVGWSGSASDYAFAVRFFHALRAGAKWKSVPILVAPGNHDVDRGSPSARQEAFVQFLRELHGAGFGEIYPLYTGSSPSDRQLLVGFRMIHSGDGDDALFVAINSAAHLEEQGTPVYINEETLRAIEDRIGGLPIPSRALRVMVLHHHLLPFVEAAPRGVRDPAVVPDEADSTIVWNSAKLQEWLVDNHFRVVLHGHKHISHGRQDILWRRRDSAEVSRVERRLFIVGAGSAGVEDSHRPRNEPLSFNVVAFSRLSDTRWQVQVAVREVSESEAITGTRALYSYGTAVGDGPTASPVVFNAERMDDCHRAISEGTAGKGLFRDFISIVDDPNYRHPDTARIGDATVTENQVRNSFGALHPEFEKTSEWNELSKLQEVFRGVSPSFRFEHGPRLFGVTGRIGSRDPSRDGPIQRAVAKLSLREVSHAYAGLFNPELDVLADRDEPVPALMSVQFVRDGARLDVVATFRKIELSFWWVVNMYEIGKLLHWAAGRAKLEARRITFFAALAEWKEAPGPAFVARIDAMGVSELAPLVLDVAMNRESAKRELRRLLTEKRDFTNDNNLDVTGLRTCRDLAVGVMRKRGRNVLSQSVIKALSDAVDNIQQAVAQAPGDRQTATDRARKAIDRAMQELGRRARGSSRR